MRSLVKGMQCALIMAGDATNELQPLILRDARLCLIGIENIAKRLLSRGNVPYLRDRRTHTTIVLDAILPVKAGKRHATRTLRAAC